MSEYINQKIDVFYGLNNKLCPASSEYREGMAWLANNARIDQNGLWSAAPALEGPIVPPGIIPFAGSGGGGHYKAISSDDTITILKNLSAADSADIGLNNYIYLTKGSGKIKYQTTNGLTTGDVEDYAKPTGMSVATGDGSGTSTRAENGTYYYIITYYDTVRDRESLPSDADSDEIDHADGAKDRIVVTTPAVPSNCTIRIYRTKRISADAGVYNPANIYYYLDEISSGTSYIDYLHDSEIENYEYEGSGKAPPQDIDYLIAYNDRMLYFKGNTMYWSRSGQPDMVAQEYTVTIDSIAVTCQPKLSVGVYGEARYKISELSGQKVTGAARFKGRLYVFTNSITGYLEPTNRLEGYRFKILREGVGLLNDKCLASSPYGVFGADRDGMWLLDDYGIKRISDGVVNFSQAENVGHYWWPCYTKIDYATQVKQNSFGLWVPVLNEYWWCVNNFQFVYQADRRIFAGPYTHAITGGCTYYSTEGGVALVTGDQRVSVDKPAQVAQRIQFWFGQASPTVIKDQLEVEIIHSATPTEAVSVTLYQNCIPSTTGATSTTLSYTNSIGKITGTGSGRYFMVDITLPVTGAPIADINYKFNAIGWSKSNGR